MNETNFKRTKVGMIPEDWKLVPLYELGEINKNACTPFPEKFVYIDLEAVSDGKLGDCKCYLKNEAPCRAQRIIQRNDILFQTVRPYQKNNLYIDFDATTYIASTGYAVIRCSKDHNSRLIYYLLHEENFVSLVIEKSTGSNYPAINSTALASLCLALPPNFEEQTRIATALSDMDALIENLEALINKKRAIKQGTMQELLSGKRRLPGFTGEWIKKEFTDIMYSCNEKSKQIESKFYLQQGKYPIIDQGKKYISGYTNHQQPINLESESYIVFGDHTCYFKYVNFPFYLGADGTQLLKCKSDLITKFIYYLCQRIVFPETGYDRHFKYLKEAILFIPPTESEQSAIASVLTSMDEEISGLEAKLEQYRALKQGMMQQLLTGKIRLI